MLPGSFGQTDLAGSASAQPPYRWPGTDALVSNAQTFLWVLLRVQALLCERISGLRAWRRGAAAQNFPDRQTAFQGLWAGPSGPGLAGPSLPLRRPFGLGPSQNPSTFRPQPSRIQRPLSGFSNLPLSNLSKPGPSGFQGPKSKNESVQTKLKR